MIKLAWDDDFLKNAFNGNRNDVTPDKSLI